MIGNGPLRWAVLGLEIVGTWAVLLAAMIGLGLLVTDPLQGSVGRADNRFEVWLAARRSSTLTTLAEIGATPGDTILVAVLGACLAAAAWAWTRSPRPAVFIVLGLIGQSTLYYLAANAVSRSRPPVKQLDSGLDPTRSFPSGHVASATTLYSGFVILVWTYVDRRWRPLAAVLLILPPIVAVSRLYQGVHHPTDVLASLIVIAIWVSVLAVLVLKSSMGSRDHEHRGR